MQRIVEPELMDDKVQAEAYAAADFEQAHGLIVEAFDRYFLGEDLSGTILDLGCGAGDISFRFARRFPESVVIGVDGSSEMIRLANEQKEREKNVGERITFIKGRLPDATLAKGAYAAIVSNSLLHHLHSPDVLWQTVLEYMSPGSKILIMDLYRPACIETAQQMVIQYSANEPDILQRDFYHSLLAAFTIKEIQQQLIDAGLTEFKIQILSDRHLCIYGEIN